MQVRVLQVHDWQWMCQTQHAPGGGGKNMNLCSLFGEKYVRAILGLDEAMRPSRGVDVRRTPIIPKAQIWTFVFRCVTWGITTCRFQHYWDFLFFQPKKCSQHAGYKEHRGKKRNCVQCTLQLGKINTANCNVRSRGFRGIHLITLSHKPAGCVLFCHTWRKRTAQPRWSRLFCWTALFSAGPCFVWILSQKKLYGMTWRDTVSVQNNSHEWQDKSSTVMLAWKAGSWTH